MQTILHDLEIPPEYARYDTLDQESLELIQNLEKWKLRTVGRLSDLALHLASTSQFSIDEQSLLLLHVAAFDGEGPWILPEARSKAQNILSSHIQPNNPLIQNVLYARIRPLFQSNSHPDVNPNTGRKVIRAAGGSSATQDFYASQPWKEESPGVANVLLWVVKHLKSDDYEKLWHLVLPPVMTLLDDFDARYKLQGLEVVAEMLKTVPAELLRRTGVDGLLFSSLKSTLTFLNNPKTSDIIRAAIPTLVALVDLTSPASRTEKSKQRFEQLSSILGEGIIGSVWMYASRDVPTITASVEILPILLGALDTGSVRFLKAMVHQLVHPLVPPPLDAELLSSAIRAEQEQLKLSSLRALKVIIQVCQPRMEFWKGTILSATTKCWVHEFDRQGSHEIKQGAKEVLCALSMACPSIINNEFALLLKADPMFLDLLEFEGAT